MKAIKLLGSKRIHTLPEIYGAKYDNPACHCGSLGEDGPCFDRCSWSNPSSAGVIQAGYQVQKSVAV